MPRLGESTRTEPHRKVLDRAGKKLDGVMPGDVAARMAAHVEAAITPKVAKGYGPKQKKRREPLNSPHHFGTMDALRQRKEMLAQFKLVKPVEAIKRQWGSTYTQALYTDRLQAKSYKVLVQELVALQATVEEALWFYGYTKPRAKKIAKKATAKAGAN